MKRLIIVGSPRSNGRSAHLAEMLFEACIDECPDDEVSLAPVSELAISACVGCNGCKNSEGHVCVFEDDMDEIREILDESDELIIVSPVYFSGAPAPMKALLDRLQPYFWTWEAGGSRRPMTLHIIGEGAGPNGYDALIDEVRAAGAVAGFRLDRIVDWVGKIDADGRITAEGEEYVPEGRKVGFARIAADDIENIHVVHAENLRQARKAKKAEKAAGAKPQAGKQAGKGGSSADASSAAKPEHRPANADDRNAPGVQNAQGRPKLNIHSTSKNQGKRGSGPSGKRGGRG